LGGNVRPVSLYAALLERCSKSIAHIIHSLCYLNELAEPFLSQLNVVEDK